MHSQLRSYGGHTHGETLGWIEGCRRRGVRLTVFGAADALPEILAETKAHPLFAFTEADGQRFAPQGDGLADDPIAQALDDFLRGTRMVARCCAEAVEIAGEMPDVMVFPWMFGSMFNGVAEWLADLEPRARPRLVLNVVRPEPTWMLDAARNKASGEFTFFRFATRRLAALAPPGGLVLTAVEPRLCKLISALSGVDCAPAPMQHDYPTPGEMAAWTPAPTPQVMTIGLIGPLREEKGADLTAAVLTAVSAVRGDVRFLLQTANLEAAKTLSAALKASRAPINADIVVGALPREQFFRRLLAADLVLFPYSRRIYALMPSGPFGEAVFSGIPVVAPSDTWLGDRLAEGWGAGEVFDEATPAGIAQATLRALGRLDELKAKAADQGEAWLKVHSTQAYIDHVLARLGV